LEEHLDQDSSRQDALSPNTKKASKKANYKAKKPLSFAKPDALFGDSYGKQENISRKFGFGSSTEDRKNVVGNCAS